MSLLFCPNAIKPDSMAIHKSSDYGKTWQPFQFYSSQCKKLYGRPAKQQITKFNEQEPRCLDHNRFANDGMSGIQGSRIAFSTLEGRPSAADFDASAILQDWVTATDIRVIFHRLQSPLASMSARSKKSDYSSKESTTMSPNSLLAAGTGTYALSDFSVGGRCKCNGHASRCVKNEDGQLECACKHNTAGRDCEKCKPFFFDRPWARATVRDANECKGEHFCLFAGWRKQSRVRWFRNPLNRRRCLRLMQTITAAHTRAFPVIIAPSYLSIVSPAFHHIFHPPANAGIYSPL